MDGSIARGPALIRAPLSTSSVLDEAAETVRKVASPWAALSIVTALPYRFAQAVFADRLIQLGIDAQHRANYLLTLAGWTMAAFVVSRWGRLVFARAVRLAVESGRAPGAAALRVRFTVLLDYLYVSLFLECVSIATLMTCLAPLLCTIVTGLAVGTAESNDRPSLAAPFRRIAKIGTNVRTATAVALVFVCAAAVAAVNVAGAFGAGLWLGSAIGGWDAQRWTLIVSATNRRFILTVIAGALVALEPFWVAAYVTFVRKAGVVESGDDLRQWFEELRSA